MHGLTNWWQGSGGLTDVLYWCDITNKHRPLLSLNVISVFPTPRLYLDGPPTVNTSSCINNWIGQLAVSPKTTWDLQYPKTGIPPSYTHSFFLGYVKKTTHTWCTLTTLESSNNSPRPHLVLSHWTLTAVTWVKVLCPFHQTVSSELPPSAYLSLINLTRKIWVITSSHSWPDKETHMHSFSCPECSIALTGWHFLRATYVYFLSCLSPVLHLSNPIAYDSSQH